MPLGLACTRRAGRCAFVQGIQGWVAMELGELCSVRGGGDARHGGASCGVPGQGGLVRESKSGVAESRGVAGGSHGEEFDRAGDVPHHGAGKRAFLPSFHYSNSTHRPSTF